MCSSPPKYINTQPPFVTFPSSPKGLVLSIETGNYNSSGGKLSFFRKKKETQFWSVFIDFTSFSFPLAIAVLQMLSSFKGTMLCSGLFEVGPTT